MGAVENKNAIPRWLSFLATSLAILAIVASGLSYVSSKLVESERLITRIELKISTLERDIVSLKEWVSESNSQQDKLIMKYEENLSERILRYESEQKEIRKMLQDIYIMLSRSKRLH